MSSPIFYLIVSSRSISNNSHKFWRQCPSPQYQCCFQVSESVYGTSFGVATLQYFVEGRGLIYFCKVEHSRISKTFYRCWICLNNLSEILSQNMLKWEKMHCQAYGNTCGNALKLCWRVSLWPIHASRIS